LLALEDALAQEVSGARGANCIDGTRVAVVARVVAATAGEADDHGGNAEEADREGAEGTIHAVKRISETVPPLKVRR
jgi:hypothetical protein